MDWQKAWSVESYREQNVEKNMIELCQEWGGTYDNTQFQVEMRFCLKKAEAKTYMEKYWK